MPEAVVARVVWTAIGRSRKGTLTGIGSITADRAAVLGLVSPAPASVKTTS